MLLNALYTKGAVDGADSDDELVVAEVELVCTRNAGTRFITTMNLLVLKIDISANCFKELHVLHARIAALHDGTDGLGKRGALYCTDSRTWQQGTVLEEKKQVSII
jgi:hypothetical protein